MPDYRAVFRWQMGLVAGAAALVVLLFVWLSALGGGPGLPLDDGWIHQTYARNLAQSGRWEYVPGVASAGSTAPLWTLLLAAGYLLPLPSLFWAYLLGAACLVWLAWSGMALWHALWPAQEAYDWLVGLALVCSWPLVWAATSGMETALFLALGLQILALYSAATRDSGWQTIAIGFLAGLLILTRPEGLILLLLVATGIGLRQKRLSAGGVAVVRLAAAAVLPLLPYFAFNLWASGTLWPNTFYAKQAEYAALLARPFMARLVQLLFFSLGGPAVGWQGMSAAHLLLLPGVVTAAWQALQVDWRTRRLFYLLPLLWAGGHVFLYAWRLPVTYQHGRYLLAALPVWVLFGLAGWRRILAGNGRAMRLAREVAGLTFALLALLFLLLGAQAYTTDVDFIEGEMVATARWLAANTPPDALVAAHDIGAIGYFAARPLLDLAGLISPEVVPLLADESALAQYLLASDADYLVTAPGWPYAAVTESSMAELIYSTNYTWTREQGLNNMSVYRLKQP